ncbi:MAG: hypothetical protein IJG38_05060 [Thermoguttaceae bacterium]|nr:hypothetical protein [Thermoguttaceae bacterium]
MKYRVKINRCILGVPIQLVRKMNHEQFDIITIGGCHSWANYKDTLLQIGYNPAIPSKGGGCVLNDKMVYARILVRVKV